MYGTFRYGLRKYRSPVPDTSVEFDFGEPVEIVDNSSHNGFPSFVICNDGTFLICYRVGTGHNSHSGVIVTQKSTTKGASWSAATTILSTAGIDYRGAHMTLLSNGDVFMSVERRDNADPGEGGRTDGCVVLRSTDCGTTWSAPTVVDTEFTEYGWGGPVIESESSALLMVVWGVDTGDPYHSSRLMISQDDGATWTTRSEIAAGGTTADENYSETGLFRRDDGTLVAIVRVGIDGNWAQTESTDDGLTWDSLTTIAYLASGYPKPAKMGDRIVAVYRDLSIDGRPARILLSDDEGMTWTRE